MTHKGDGGIVIEISLQQDGSPSRLLQVRIPAEYVEALEKLRLAGITKRDAVSEGLRLFISSLKDLDLKTFRNK